MISAVIRTNVLKSILPKSHFGFVNPEWEIQMITDPAADWLNSIYLFKQGKINNDLIYSKIIVVPSMDKKPWYLWVAYPDSSFYLSAERFII